MVTGRSPSQGRAKLVLARLLFCCRRTWVPNAIYFDAKRAVDIVSRDAARGLTASGSPLTQQIPTQSTARSRRSATISAVRPDQRTSIRR
ncbi:hypothetical protein Enr13x_03450 [Stieleria neptunia]|uniref:Uncharacterized protein n=1 Tax=Stieleria neptunia TaxID=2527979 RepID=A0A518HI94_9BACT|nr:hypothetical protein Enr13x_03450 [Stieleria neptunia]